MIEDMYPLGSIRAQIMPPMATVIAKSTGSGYRIRMLTSNLWFRYITFNGKGTYMCMCLHVSMISKCEHDLKMRLKQTVDTKNYVFVHNHNGDHNADVSILPGTHMHSTEEVIPGS